MTVTIEPFDLAQASRAVGELLDEFGAEAAQASHMTSATLWNHHRDDDHPIIAIYVALDPGFRREAATLSGALAQIRVELVARFGERS